jgi:SAM-dependent methyltransferase
VTGGDRHGHGPHKGAEPQGTGPAHAEMDQESWDQRYRTSTALWSGQPNAQLLREAADLTPGTALDVGCGEGADAIWLAGRGWRVTAVDFSTVALDRAAAHAREVGRDVAERITWLPADLTRWIPPPSSSDLVSAQFMHLPKHRRDTLFHRLAEAVTPGGWLLIVGHHPDDLLTTVPRPRVPELLFTAADVAALLDARRWTIVVNEARGRPAVDPEGRTVTVHDAVLRAQRRF